MGESFDCSNSRCDSAEAIPRFQIRKNETAPSSFIQSIRRDLDFQMARFPMYSSVIMVVAMVSLPRFDDPWDLSEKGHETCPSMLLVAVDSSTCCF